VSIVGGLDIHRKQITFDYLDVDSGQVWRGQISPADREHLAAWLAERFDPDRDGLVELAVEACTGWRYVAEELARAGIIAHLAEPAETAVLRGPKRRAKTDRADARLLRELVATGRLPECWIPPAHILECRALLECYHDLRMAHTAWTQRVHAVVFHQGTPTLGVGALGTAEGRARLGQVAEQQLSPAGRVQVQTALAMLEATKGQLDVVGRQVRGAAGRVHGARVLAQRLYGVGPMTALALVCWLGGQGRFHSARKAVRFVGLDVTVYSSAGKRSPGRLSRQGPGVLRWLVYEAGKTHARQAAPDHDYYTTVKDRIDGKRATLSEARKLVRRAVHILDELGDQALALVEPRS
jgi:transposase